MLDVGFWEIAVVLVVLLLVVGPERLPKLAKSVGHHLAGLKRFYRRVQDEAASVIDEESKKKDSLE